MKRQTAWYAPMVFLALGACSKEPPSSAGSRGGSSLEPASTAPSALASKAPIVDAAPADRWFHGVKHNKMDDSQIVIVKLPADEDVTTNIGGSFRPQLVIGCDNDSTFTMVDTGSLLVTEVHSWQTDEADGYTSGTPGRVRLDKDPPISNFGATSDDHKAEYLTPPIPLIKKMLGHTTLLIEFAPVGRSPQTATFTITGVGEAIAAVRAACHW